MSNPWPRTMYECPKHGLLTRSATYAIDDDELGCVWCADTDGIDSQIVTEVEVVPAPPSGTSPSAQRSERKGEHLVSLTEEEVVALLDAAERTEFSPYSISLGHAAAELNAVLEQEQNDG